VCLDHLEDAVRRLGVSQIIVALEDQQDALPVAELVRLRLGGTTVSDAPELLSALSGRVRLDVVTPGGLLFGEGSRPSETPLMWKRGLDLFFGLIGACIFAPIMALVALAVWLDCGRPILLWQTRVGWKGKEFRLLKFRTMRVDAEPNGEAQWAAVNDPRVTRVGAFLRAYHLDELPQFINVIRGEMSFVGPRPERPGFVAHLRAQIPYYEERLLVRPGVTGWAQVQYPYAATVADAARKLEYDLFYLKNMSFAFDCAIALKTVRIVLLKWGSR
jgi:exopolysaccharide biosynthesis polyprenyl glycosylphosphotransferase